MEPNELQLATVQGWLDLGDFKNAQEELRSIPASLQDHPDVLRLWLASYVVENNWLEVQKYATRLRLLAPSDPEAALHTAEALHRLGRTTDAVADLTHSAAIFSDRSIVSYTLARYYRALDMPTHALSMLAEAFAIRPRLLRKALEDPDLAAIVLPRQVNDASFIARHEPEK